MRPPYPCTKGFHPLDSNSGYYLNFEISLVPAVAWRNAEDWLGIVVLLARRPMDASPDALHPGKARESSEMENSFSFSDVPGLSWARSLQTFRHPNAAGGACLLTSTT